MVKIHIKIRRTTPSECIKGIIGMTVMIGCVLVLKQLFTKENL